MVAELLVISISLSDGCFIDLLKPWRTIKVIITKADKRESDFPELHLGEWEKAADRRHRFGAIHISSSTLWMRIIEICSIGIGKAVTIQH